MIGLLGISMGGQAALRLAFKYPQMFPVASGIASALDHHLFNYQTASDDTISDKEQCL